MSERTERPLAELVRELALFRQTQRLAQAEYDEYFREWQSEMGETIDTLQVVKTRVANLEATIRARGAALAAEQGRSYDPVPGTKARHEKVIRYVRVDEAGNLIVNSDGEIMGMDASVQRLTLVDYAIEHQYRNMLKPDTAGIEKLLKALAPDARPPWLREEWQTVVSIDADLSPLLAEDNETAPGE